MCIHMPVRTLHMHDVLLEFPQVEQISQNELFWLAKSLLKTMLRRKRRQQLYTACGRKRDIIVF